MSVKKSTARTKEKTSHSATATVAKHKRPASGCLARRHSASSHPGRESLAESKEADKDTGPVMDARTNKDRRHVDRRETEVSVELERRTGERRAKVNRRRQIDPTTCERDYSQEEIEFMSALDDYKRRSGRMFPTCSEVLEVIKGLGYEKRSEVVVVTPAAEIVSVVEVATEQAV